MASHSAGHPVLSGWRSTWWLQNRSAGLRRLVWSTWCLPLV